MLDKAIIFSLTKNVKVTNEVCSYLKISEGVSEVKHFSDGEIIANSTQTVRGKHVYVIQSTCEPVNESLMELLIFIDACKRASAREITAVIPYFGYARQDRQAAPRQPVSAKLVADLLQTAGVNRVITFDLHTSQIQGFFNCPVDNLTASNMFVKYYKEKFKNNDNLVIVSPDSGGAKRARLLAEKLDCSIAIFDKRRPKPNVAEMVNVIGDVNGKICIIVDDMIDTGGTIIAATDFLIKSGARSVYACCTHPVFTKNFVERLNESNLTEVVTTNTIQRNEKSDKLVVLSIAEMLAKTIKLIEEDKSIAPIYDE